MKLPPASLASRLFGYDVFVSFALGGPPRGSQSYASDLSRRLRERDITVFFSEDEAPPGSPLSDTLRRALLHSKMLVVIVNRGTLALPNWVRTEVETFRVAHPGRPVIPITLDGSFRDAALSASAQPWLQHTGNIWLDEAPEAAARGLVTDTLLARLLTAPRRLRANTLWRGLVAAVGLGLIALSALAAWQAVVATRERDQAAALRDQALSRQLAAQSAASLVRDPVRALLLAAQSQAVVTTTASDGALLGAVASLPLAGLKQHVAALQALAVRPNSDAFVVADARGAVLQGGLAKVLLDTVLPPATGMNLYGMVRAIAFAPDGKSWAHAGSSREITLHAEASTRKFPDGDKIGESTVVIVFGLAFSPDGRTLASASSSGALRLHAVADGSSRLLLRSAFDLVSVAFSPNGRWVAAGGDRGFLQAVPVTAGASAPRLDAAPNGTVQALAFEASGQRLFTASRGGRIEVFDAHDGRRTSRQDAPEQGALETMAVSPDGRFVATGHGSGAVLLWSVRDGDDAWPRRVLVRHAAPVSGLAFAADGRTLLTAGADGRLFVTLPVDRGRWQRVAQADIEPATTTMTPTPTTTPQVTLPPLVPEEARSADGRWIAWSGTLASRPSPFDIDPGQLAATRLPRITVLRAPGRQPVVDGAELPAAPGERIVAGPVFSADGTQLAVQVGERLLFWDPAASQALEATLALPPDARLIGASTGALTGASTGASTAAAGWLAGSEADPRERFSFAGDRSTWVTAVCALAGRALTREEWRRDVGDDRPYALACRGP